jgi:hypothetical protein
VAVWNWNLVWEAGAVAKQEADSGKNADYSETEKRGGCMSGPRRVSQLRPPPKSITRTTSSNDKGGRRK